MINSVITISGIGAAAAAYTGAIIAQTPTTTEVGEWGKLGVSGACLALTGYLVTVHIPKILDIGKSMNEATRQTMEKGFTELEQKFDANAARQNELTKTLIDKVLGK